jgi:hypothetical protein
MNQFEERFWMLLGMLLFLIGGLLMMGGTVAALGFWNMNTTYGAVHNIGLMQQQQMGFLASLFAIGLGILLCVLSWPKDRR